MAVLLVIELPHEPAALLLGVSPTGLKAGTQTSTHACVFMAALLAIARRWEQPRCALTDEWAC